MHDTFDANINGNCIYSQGIKSFKKRCFEYFESQWINQRECFAHTWSGHTSGFRTRCEIRTFGRKSHTNWEEIKIDENRAPCTALNSRESIVGTRFWCAEESIQLPARENRDHIVRQQSPPCAHGFVSCIVLFKGTKGPVCPKTEEKLKSIHLWNVEVLVSHWQVVRFVFLVFCAVLLRFLRTDVIIEGNAPHAQSFSKTKEVLNVSEPKRN